MNCRHCKNEIEERDRRREILSGAAEAHLAACANCRVFDEERVRLRQLIGGLEKISAPPDFDVRLRARMNAAARGHAARFDWLKLSPAALAWSAVAGCLALIVSASFYLQPEQLNFDVPQPEQARLVIPQMQPAGEEINSTTTSRAESATKIEMPLPPVEILRRNAPAPRRSSRSVRTSARQKRSETARVVNRNEESNVSSVRGSSATFAPIDVQRGASSSIPLQFRVPGRPLEILLGDAQGTPRTLSIDSVSFGSQDVIKRPAKFSNASLSSNQGVW